MKKLLVTFLGLGLLSQQALAVSVLDEEFAGYVDTVVGKSAGVWMDLGTQTDQSQAATISTGLADITASITDFDPGTWVGGLYDEAGTYVNGPFDTDYLDLSFNAGVVNGDGDDLKIFFVGGSGQTVDMTIGTQTVQYSLPSVGNPDDGDTGAKDTVYTPGEYPIVALGIDLGDFSELAGPVTQFRLTIGDRWCDEISGTSVSGEGECSSLPSFVGGYNVVPVPAAVWLFGSGLVGLVGIAKRRKR